MPRFVPAVVVAAAALFAGTACAGSASQAAPSPTPSAVAFVPHGGLAPSFPRPKPALRLVDTAGQSYDLRARTAGTVTMLYLGYTNCADVCKTTMADIATALRQVGTPGRDKVSVVFVTTDPKRDTPAVLRSWLAKFDPTFVGLTGSPEEIVAAQRLVGVPPATTSGAAARSPLRAGLLAAGTALPRHEPSPKPGSYNVDHFAGILLYDRTGTLVAMYPEGVAVANLVTDLKSLTG